LFEPQRSAREAAANGVIDALQLKRCPSRISQVPGNDGDGIYCESLPASFSTEPRGHAVASAACDDCSCYVFS
jgi:hypothetical protein